MVTSKKTMKKEKKKTTTTTKKKKQKKRSREKAVGIYTAASASNAAKCHKLERPWWLKR